jgi:hypothetical protein
MKHFAFFRDNLLVISMLFISLLTTCQKEPSFIVPKAEQMSYKVSIRTDPAHTPCEDLPLYEVVKTRVMPIIQLKANENCKTMTMCVHCCYIGTPVHVTFIAFPTLPTCGGEVDEAIEALVDF